MPHATTIHSCSNPLLNCSSLQRSVPRVGPGAGSSLLNAHVRTTRRPSFWGKTQQESGPRQRLFKEYAREQ